MVKDELEMEVVVLVVVMVGGTGNRSSSDATAIDVEGCCGIGIGEIIGGVGCKGVICFYQLLRLRQIYL